MRARTRARQASGFTLVELLVAAAITAALAGALVAIVVQVLGLWSRSGSSVTTAGEVTRVLEQISRDLEAMVCRPDASAWFAVTVQRDQAGAGDSGMTDADWTGAAKPSGLPSLRLDPTDGSLEDQRFGQAGVWLRFFTTEPDANDSATNRSLPRAVSYQIVRRRTGRGHAYQLYRSQVRPGGANSTFSSGYDLFASPYNTPNGSEQHPGNIRRPNTRFLLGNHVIDLGLRVFVRAGDGGVEPAFPLGPAAEQSFVATTGTSPVPGYAGRPVTRGRPVRLDVLVRILTEEGAQAIANLEAGRIPVPPGLTRAEHWWGLAEAHSRVHVRTVVPRVLLP